MAAYGRGTAGRVTAELRRSRLLVRCPLTADPTPFVAEQVLPALAGVDFTHRAVEPMLEAMYEFYERWGGREATVIACAPVPVEARLFWLMLADRPERWERGPFPLLDVATTLSDHGFDPTDLAGYVRRFGVEVPVPGRLHNPLWDAAAAYV